MTKENEMTRRDMFAAAAMQGELANDSTGMRDENDFAKYAYKIADAMEQARGE